MRKAILAAAAVVAAIAGGAPTATATPSYATLFGCGYYSTSNQVTNGTFVGTLFDVSVTTGLDDLPVYADVTCEIRVNGVPVVSGTWSGFGVQAGAKPISFVIDDDDRVRLCYRIVYDHGAATESACPQPDLSFPGPTTYALLNRAAAEFEDRGCPVLAANATQQGPVRIDSDGDVSVDPLGLLVDCPPYVP